MQLLGSGGELIASTTFLIGSCGQLLAGLGVLFALALVKIAPKDEFPAGVPLFSARQQAGAVKLGAGYHAPALLVMDGAQRATLNPAGDRLG